MRRLTSACLALLCVVGPTAGSAADFSDPTWPCVQRKVGELSLGLMWPLPVDAARLPDEAARRAVSNLAEALSLRRTELDDLEPQVAAFAAAHKGDAQMLGAVFADVFGRLSNRRTRVIGGIERFSLSQIALAEKIDGMRAEMSALMTAESPDYDKVDTLEERIDWDQVIYTDRQKSITYLCETPQLLERRLFAIAQMLQRHVVTDG